MLVDSQLLLLLEVVIQLLRGSSSPRLPGKLLQLYAPDHPALICVQRQMLLPGGVTSLLKQGRSHAPVFLASTRFRLESLVEPVVPTLCEVVALITTVDETLLVYLSIHLDHADRRAYASPLMLHDHFQLRIRNIFFVPLLECR